MDNLNKTYFFQANKGIIIKGCLIFRTSAVFFILSLLFFQGCKNETVQPKINNNQTQTIPVLISPNDGSTAKTLSPIVSWQSFPSALSYELQISLDANMQGTMILDSSGITDTMINIPGGKLTTNIYYYWRIRANISGNNESQWSNIWRFNIIFNAPPPPTLIAPPNGSLNQSYTPLLQWGLEDSAQFYRVQLSAYPNFSTYIFDSSRIQINEITVPLFILNSGTQYFWRANASNSNGASTSQWSTVFNFTTLSGPRPNSISGTITFVDTNFIQPFMSYQVLSYSSWPPGSTPAGNSDTFSIMKSGNTYFANYRITHLYNGSYYIVSTYSSTTGNQPMILGIYGCDTVHINYSNCPINPPVKAQITNNNGAANINFLTWADTSKRIY